MKYARLALLLATSLASFTLFAAYSQLRVRAFQSATALSGAPGALGVVRVQGSRVIEIDNSHLRLAVDLIMTPSQTATLEDLHLASLRLNGLPAFAEPLSQQINLVQGKDTALPPVYITVQFRDVTTVTPLRDMIEKQSVHVQGQVSAGIRMNFLDRLALHTQHPRVSLTLNDQVPVTFASSPLHRQASLGILTLIEFGLHGAAIARKEIPGIESQWVHDLAAQASNYLLHVQTTYQVKEHKSTYPVAFDQLGFQLPSGRVVVTAEAIRPWEFDPEFLGRLKSGEIKMVKKSTDLQLHSIGRQLQPLSLIQGDFTVEQRGNAEQQGLLVQRGETENATRINIRRRATPDAFGLILLKNPSVAGGFAIAPVATSQLQSWDKVAVYRMMQDPATGQRSVDVIQLSAERDGQSIHFDEPVDPTFFGSPILVPEGVLGIVQDEQVGAFLPADLVTTAGSGATAAR
jgi:hypothetical protein